MSAPLNRPSLLVPDARIRARGRAEARFRALGIGAIAIALLALCFLLVTVVRNGAPGFFQTHAEIPVDLSAAHLDPEGNRDPAALRKVTTIAYNRLLAGALADWVAENEPGIDGLTGQDFARFLSNRAGVALRDRVLADPGLIGSTVTLRLLTSSRVDGIFKGRVTAQSAARDSRISPAVVELAQAMQARGVLVTRFNPAFLTGLDGADDQAETAGLGTAMIGSAYMMAVVLVLALPLGVAASIYLEEFAPQNRLTDVIEVNIANLAAVPSIVFGILGLAVFINFAGLPRSAPLVGGLVLVLMTLPTIIITTRAALKSVPPGIRDAALGIGASRMQTVFHHVLPLAMPGILTGAIIGLAQALGETAPLLLIGMVAFVPALPGTPMDPATALPVQIYRWTQQADPAFAERAWGAIIVLLAFLLCMNLLAIWLRRRFERRW